MRIWWLGFASILLVASCTKSNPAVNCTDGSCSDPAFPYCDVDGIEGMPNTCIAVTCTANAFVECDGDSAVTCNSTGDSYDTTVCQNGCVVAENGCHQTPPPPHLKPIYLSTVCDTPAMAANLTITSSGSFDPNLDSNCNGGIVTQTGGPDICVVRYGSISINMGNTLTIAGGPSVGYGRVIAFVADQALTIDGVLDVSAHGSSNGPGGGVLSSGGMMVLPNGGGGAGFKTAGGSGGNATSDGGAANGGVAMMDPALITALIGGASSTRLETDAPDAYFGGGGGGATLISCEGAVLVTGTISAGGGGASSGVFFINPASGFGGGAGGYVVLQGMNVIVTGELFANGGAGGGGTQANHDAGIRGADGSLSDSFPAPGGPSQDGEGDGGNGGYVGANPGSGGHPTMAGASAGGGGGSIGFFQSYTPTGVTPTLTPSHASPAFQPNGTVPTS